MKTSAMIYPFLIAFLSTTVATTVATTASSSNFTFEGATIMTICHMNDITITHNGEPTAHCDLLPPSGSVEDFFDVSSTTVWEMLCDETSNDEPINRKATPFESSIRGLHGLVEGVQKKIRSLGRLLIFAIGDVSRFSLITRRWNVYWFLVGGLASSLMFFVQGLYISRGGKILYNIIFNLLIGFSSTTAFYMVHLYFQNLYVMAVFVTIGIFVFSPLYPKLSLSALGVITSMELLIPLFGFCIMQIFETKLFFGPVVSLIINSISIVIHIICLMGLYIDEKLILVKVFLLPFYRMFQSVSDLNEQNEKEIKAMEESARQLNTEIFKTLRGVEPPEVSQWEQWDKDFNKILQDHCVNKTNDWNNEDTGKGCRKILADACMEMLYKINEPIAWILDNLLRPVYDPCDRAAKDICAQNKITNVAEYCSMLNGTTGFGAAYKYYQDALTNLTREIVIDPLAPKVNEEIEDMAAGFDLFAAKWTWWLRHGISWGLAALCIAVILLSFVYAISFLLKYRRNVHFCNNYLDRATIESMDFPLTRREKSRYYSSFTSVLHDYIYILYKYPSRFAESIRLICKVVFCFWLEQTEKYLHNLLKNVQFVVPNYASAKFIFNVQGNGLFAFLMKAILGGFSLESKYCKITDTSVCNTAFIPVDWRTWHMLFLLAIFYFLIGWYQSKSDYIMCRICDFLIPQRGKERTEVTMDQVTEERHKRGVVVNGLAEEEIKYPVFLREQNHLVLSFFKPRCWYHRFMPTIVLSTIAYWKFAVDSIMCQICGQDIVTARYRCKNLLFCEECACHITHCPCESDACEDNVKFNV